MRGKYNASKIHAWAGGLIPARAGKIPHSRGPRIHIRAHPRACGENLKRPRNVVRQLGSSPRVRGKFPRVRNRRVDRGLIPARAGKTRPRTPWTGSRWAHPRVCGENPLAAAEASADRGSSPRVRGKRVRLLDDPGEVRLIPACAGKTSPMRTKVTPRAAHPRVCGENSAWCGAFQVWGGSSPRVRGKRAAGTR